MHHERSRCQHKVGQGPWHAGNITVHSAQLCALNSIHLSIQVPACINGNLSTNLEEELGVQ